MLARIENDVPALKQLLTDELQRAARGRPVTWVAGKAFERLPRTSRNWFPTSRAGWSRNTEATLLMSGLLKYGPKAKDAVPALRKVLCGPAVPYHAYFGFELRPACEVLGAIGPDARERCRNSGSCLDTADVALALAARDAIRKIEGKK